MKFDVDLSPLLVTDCISSSYLCHSYLCHGISLYRYVISSIGGGERLWGGEYHSEAGEQCARRRFWRCCRAVLERGGGLGLELRVESIIDKLYDTEISPHSIMHDFVLPAKRPFVRSFLLKTRRSLLCGVPCNPCITLSQQ